MEKKRAYRALWRHMRTLKRRKLKGRLREAAEFNTKPFPPTRAKAIDYATLCGSTPPSQALQEFYVNLYRTSATDRDLDQQAFATAFEAAELAARIGDRPPPIPPSSLHDVIARLKPRRGSPDDL
eukprot:9366927-Prorocentrum_lima.AAC.1